jgi:hypothetical protein
MLLKKAWIIICENDRTQRPIEIVYIIIPNWLRVDIATIFFTSLSNIAQNPEMSIVPKNKILIMLKLIMLNK